MKALFKAFFFLAVTGLFASCDKNLLDVDFNYKAKSMEFVIDSTEQGTVLLLDTMEISTADFDSALTANKTKRSDITSVKIAEVLIYPDSGRNDLFYSLNGYLSAAGLAEKQIMHADYASVAKGNGLQIYDVELLPYINKSTMRFHAAGIAGITTKERSKVRITLRYTIQASI